MLLAACGGGGGGGGGDPAEVVEYTGNNEQAHITADNAAFFADRFMYNAQSILEDSAAAGPRHSHLRAYVPPFKRSTAGDRNSAVSSTQNCPGGGQVTLDSNLNADGIGTYRLTYKQCVDIEYIVTTTYNGVIRITSSAADRDSTEYIGFTAKTVNPNTNLTEKWLRMDGIIASDFWVSPELYSSTTDNVLYNDLLNNFQVQHVNLTTTFLQSTPYIASISGRIYHSVYGYVDARTDTPFALPANSETLFPKMGGPVILAGANNSSMALGSSVGGLVPGYSEHTFGPRFDYAVAADMDGDGQYEAFAGRHLYSAGQTLLPLPPVEIAGGLMHSARTGSGLELSAGATTDLSGGFVAYQWDVVQSPGNAQFKLENGQQPTASFTATTPGYYVLRAVVSRGDDSSSAEIQVLAYHVESSSYAIDPESAGMIYLEHTLMDSAHGRLFYGSREFTMSTGAVRLLPAALGSADCSARAINPDGDTLACLRTNYPYSLAVDFFDRVSGALIKSIVLEGENHNAPFPNQQLIWPQADWLYVTLEHHYYYTDESGYGIRKTSDEAWQLRYSSNEVSELVPDSSWPELYDGWLTLQASPDGTRVYLTALANGATELPSALMSFDTSGGRAALLWQKTLPLVYPMLVGEAGSGIKQSRLLFAVPGVVDASTASLPLLENAGLPENVSWTSYMLDTVRQDWWLGDGDTLYRVAMLDGRSIGPFSIPKDDWMKRVVRGMMFDATTGKHYAQLENEITHERLMISF